MPEPAIRARNVGLLVFTGSGFALASWMSRVPNVRDLLALSPGQLSLPLLSISAGALVGLPLAGRAAHRLGANRSVLVSMAVAMVGLTLAAIAVQTDAGLFLAMSGLFLFGAGVGVWDVAQNIEGTIVEQALGRAIMPWFHAAFSVGTVMAALLGALMVWLRIPFVVHMGAAVVLIAGLVLWSAGAVSACLRR